MKLLSRALVAFACGAIVSATVATASVAHANFRRISASTCYPYNPDPAYLVVDVFGRWVNSTSAGKVLICAFPEDTTLPRSGLSHFYVDMNNNSGGANYVQAKACAGYANGTGGACGTASTSYTSGWNSPDIDRSAWDGHPYDYMVVYASIPQGGSTFNGMLGN